MDMKRNRERTQVNIGVTVATVLDSLDAVIANMSTDGALIKGASLPVGTRFRIEYLGQTTFAHSVWSEIDRMGVRFPFGLSDGPLHDALALALHDGSDFPSAVSRPLAPALLARPAMAFGKRFAN
jgi:hypothetical protein